MRRPLVLTFTLLMAACGPSINTTESSQLVSSTAPVVSTSSSTTSTLGTTTTTSSPPWQDPGVVLVLGDWGSGTEPQGAVAGAMSRYSENHDVSAITTTGDNFYSDNSAFLMVPLSWATEKEIPFWITWGNHDIETSRREAIVNEVFDSPPKWTTHQWGQVTLVILDSNQITDASQLTFLDETMAATTGPTILVFHHPAYSCSKHGDNGEVKESWLARFDSDVVLVISGHDHNYQRIVSDGLTYVVSGGGGRTLYELEACDHNLVVGQDLHHFLAMEQSEDGIEVSAINLIGEAIDSFTIEFTES